MYTCGDKKKGSFLKGFQELLRKKDRAKGKNTKKFVFISMNWLAWWGFFL